jgi:hypothetical protein
MVVADGDWFRYEMCLAPDKLLWRKSDRRREVLGGGSSEIAELSWWR